MNLTLKWKTKRKRKRDIPRPEADLAIAQSNPVGIGALGTVSKDIEKWLSEIGAHVIQNHCREHDYWVTATILHKGLDTSGRGW